MKRAFWCLLCLSAWEHEPRRRKGWEETPCHGQWISCDYLTDRWPGCSPASPDYKRGSPAYEPIVPNIGEWRDGYPSWIPYVKSMSRNWTEYYRLRKKKVNVWMSGPCKGVWSKKTSFQCPQQFGCKGEKWGEVMEEGVPQPGSVLSLISNNNVKYVGTLFHIDMDSAQPSLRLKNGPPLLLNEHTDPVSCLHFYWAGKC